MASNFDSMRSESNKEGLRDIYHITFLLRQKLVPDVVPAIIHHAGLFERHTYSTGRTQPYTITERSAPSTCLETKPIQSSARVQNPVRKVVFAIRSCDQGWTSQRDGGSWTWFTAGVIKPTQSTQNEEAEHRLGKMTLDDTFLNQERGLFRNEIASGIMRTHIVEWTIESENEEERRWISGLENGDTIAVRAWAQFGGWENKVGEVSVAVYTAAVV